MLGVPEFQGMGNRCYAWGSGVPRDKEYCTVDAMLGVPEFQRRGNTVQ